MSSSSDLVLVTGASGFIGSHIVSQLLARGSHVRAGARSDSSTSGLRKHFEKEVASGALTFAYVADITAEGAFDDAVKGVTGIIHAASPLPDRFKGDARKDLLDPAIKGATSILRSAAKESSVKSFILTSSVVSHTDLQGPNGKQVDDETWSPLTIEYAEKTGHPWVIYAAAKLHAEKAAWEVIEELKPSWRFATVAPTFVAGSTILETHNIAQGTNGYLFSFANGNLTVLGDAEKPGSWVHVSDVAAVHLRALLDEPKADRQRFLTSSGTLSPLDVAKFARRLHSDLNDAAEPKNTKENPAFEVLLTNNTKDILGIEYIGIEAIIKEVVEQGLAQRKAGVSALL